MKTKAMHLILAGLSIVFPIIARANTETTLLGPVLFVPTATYNAGIVFKGSKIAYAFILCNIGDECLTIDMQTGMGNFMRVSLEPGEETKVEEKMYTEDDYASQRVSWSYQIGTNERIQYIKSLTIKAIIIENIVVNPQRSCHLDCSLDGTPQSQEWELIANGISDFDILKIEVEKDAYCQAEHMIQYTKVNQGHWVVRIGPKEQSAAKYSSCRYTIRTTDSLQPLIHLLYWGGHCK
jgi:hypothetical protein